MVFGLGRSFGVAGIRAMGQSFSQDANGEILHLTGHTTFNVAFDRA